MRGTARRAAALAMGAALIAGLTSCELDFGSVAANAKPFSQSTDPEVKKVDEAQANAEKIKKAAVARDKFLRSGSTDDLSEALKLNPDDPELSALLLVERSIIDDQIGGAIAGSTLTAQVAARRKAQGLPDDKAATRQEANRLYLDAQARVLAGSYSGGIPKPAAGTRQEFLLSLYCKTLSKHKAKYGDGDWLTGHALDFGLPC